MYNVYGSGENLMLDQIKKHWKKLITTALLAIAALLAGNADVRSTITNFLKEAITIVSTTQPS